MTQTLIPAPQPWVVCKAVGNGTICEGTQTGSYGPDDTGIVCGTGAGAFDVYDSGTFITRKTKYYNADGYLTKIVDHDRYVDAAWTNLLTGAIVPYTQSNVITDVLAVPGDRSTITETNVGENIYRDPVTNTIVAQNVGRFVIGPDGDVLFESGKQDILDYFTSDPAALADLCAALGAS